MFAEEAPSQSAGERKFHNPYYENSEFRTKKLVVEGHPFYVNPSFLAEKCSFFKNIFFGAFRENTQEEIELKDENAANFAVFLNLIGANAEKFTPLNTSNLTIAADYADKWQIEYLKDQCRSFASERKNYADMRVNDAIEVLRVSIQLKLGRDAIVTAVSYISSRFPPSVLEKNKLHEKITSSGIVLAITRRFSWRHVSCSLANEIPPLKDYITCSKCSRSLRVSDVYKCSSCKNFLCGRDYVQTECSTINEHERSNPVHEDLFSNLF